MIPIVSFFTFINLVESNLMIYPPGPVLVYQVKQFTKTKFVLTCNSSESISTRLTWEIPALNFAELANQNVYLQS